MGESLLVRRGLALPHIPDGLTATPVDNYKTWLRCAGMEDTFGALEDVIADSIARNTLCNNLNALRYMVRSTSVIFPAILNNSQWVNEIDSCSSSVVIPSMTGFTVPSGEASASNTSGSGYEAWRAFDKNNTSFWRTADYQVAGAWLRYKFEIPVLVYKIVTKFQTADHAAKNFKFQGSSNESTWEDIYTGLGTQTTDDQTFTFANSEHYQYNQLLWIDNWGNERTGMAEMQYYGLNLL